ncbi:hypothetical protein QYM36_017865 [Artemia franciscana]|uniref:Peptidase A2 domain-containing protein n=1 Tax=Artemia franciscana TaxID=6661 RepID=A0AA88KRV9_ARTSF|nr:hypothetical protein QYM36_017865 [Artemia franciscana]
MAAINMLNPKAELARASQALAVNISAAKGIQDVMKTNLGPKGTMKMYELGDDPTPQKQTLKYNYTKGNYESFQNFILSLCITEQLRENKYNVNEVFELIHEALVSQIAETAEEDEILLYVVQQDGSKDEAFVPLKINNQTTVSFKIDTGAQANIIPKHYFDLLAPKPLIQLTKQKLTSYCGSTIPTAGTCLLSCSYNGAPEQKHRFSIAGGNSVPIL